MSFEFIFNHNTWALKKEGINELLKAHKFPNNLFVGQTIIGLDFTGIDLSGQDLRGCIFFKVNLSGVDLTDTIFNNTVFIRCNLIGAFFRYSIRGMDRLFKITSDDRYGLVKQYSNLMNEKEKMEEVDLSEEVADLAKQAEYLNHIFEFLLVDLIQNDLRNFNLIDINFSSVFLVGAGLEGVRLSKEFRVPSYRPPKCDPGIPGDLFDKFKESVNNDTYEKKYYLRLINNYFNFFDFVSNDDLKEVKWEGLDLKSAWLMGAQLQSCNLKGVNFTRAYLKDSNLTNTNLIGAIFKGNDLYNSDLRGAKFSESFQLDYNQPSDLFEKWYDANINNTSDKEYYNLLVENKFNIFDGISKERLLDAFKNKLNLCKANLSKFNLENVQLSGVNLESTYIENSNFNKSILVNINLKNSCGKEVKFFQARLENVKFDLSELESAEFKQSILRSVSFKGADLGWSDFTDAVLEDVDFYGADIGKIKLSDMVRLPDSDDDQVYVEFYHSCKDPKAKALLKVILQSRDLKL